MADALPKLDRERLLDELLAAAERTVNEVADAVDDAAAGRLIRDSEEPARHPVQALVQGLQNLQVQRS